jgi:cation:H+ antiporter
MIFFYLLLILIFSFLLVKATDILIVNFKSLSLKTGLRKFAITGLVLGLATSLPELFVGLSSAFAGKSILSLGNIIGANIANLSLVVGGAALVGGVLKVEGFFLRKDVFYVFLAAAAPMILLVDKVLSRIDGLILLIFYIFYQIVIFNEEKHGHEFKKTQEIGVIQRLIRKINHSKTKKEISWILLSIIILLFSSDFLIRVANKLAVNLNLPLILIGLLVISIGTTLPELVFGIKAIKDRQSSMVFGNLSGSIVANATLVIGLVALISPIHVQAFNSYLLATMAFVIIFVLFYLFIHTKHRLERWEGGLLFLVYLIFVFLEFRGF